MINYGGKKDCHCLSEQTYHAVNLYGKGSKHWNYTHAIMHACMAVLGRNTQNSCKFNKIAMHLLYTIHLFQK